MVQVEGGDNATPKDLVLRVQCKDEEEDDDDDGDEEDDGGGDGDAASVDPLTGVEVEAVSTITQPSIDLEGTYHDPTPRVNVGDPALETGPTWMAPFLTGDESTNVTHALALDPAAAKLKKLVKGQAAPKLVPKPEILGALGAREFESR